ncbi:SEC-C domain-containing protein [Streptomyces sp. SID13031]|uniref:SEC-C domain-containing protein n=1 Tax=Streptomyces sp. SID13031 TaxID=2706046 RepID=UPI001941128D|nr:SEC-C domain-containing protein [Streptomyces sp. SID13031]
MDDSIAEKLRACCAPALSDDRGEDADQAHLDHAEYLFDENEDADAYAELNAVLSSATFLSEPWLRAIEIVEDHKPALALGMYLLAMETITPEGLRSPVHAAGYLHLAAARRRLKWELDIPLSDADLLIGIDSAEGMAKSWRLLDLVAESQVADEQPRFWDRGALAALTQSRPRGTFPEQPDAYYLEIEAVLRARGGGRIVANRMSLADWKRLQGLTDDARHLEDLQTIVSGHDGGARVEWPPKRNEPCWCGSGVKYKKCCGWPPG